MAFGLLDGTNGTIDVMITLPSAGTGTSGKAIFGFMSIRIGADMQEQSTFATGAWRTRIKTMRQARGRLEGFVSTGSALSDPLALVGTQASLPLVATFFTGCTITFNAQFSSDEQSVRATQNSARGVDFESAGTVTTAWVIV